MQHGNESARCMGVSQRSQDSFKWVMRRAMSYNAPAAWWYLQGLLGGIIHANQALTTNVVSMELWNTPAISGCFPSIIRKGSNWLYYIGQCVFPMYWAMSSPLLYKVCPMSQKLVHLHKTIREINILRTITPRNHCYEYKTYLLF